MRILVALSGGIDSTVTAALLAEQGHELVGLNMRVWLHGNPNDSCHSSNQLREAHEAAERYGFEIRQVDLREEFHDRVVNYFVNGYLQGETPNPCVLCNRKVKFGLLMGFLDEFNCEKMATGHYTQIGTFAPTGHRALRRNPHNRKDQTYFLNRLTPGQLRRFMPVLGGMTKDQARAEARRLGLRVADKPESREICFLPDNDYRGFLAALQPQSDAFSAGEIVDRAGNVLGTHNGIANYTIGQRKGLGIAHERPLYVIRIDRENKRVVVGEKQETLTDTCRVRDMNWAAIDPPDAPLRIAAQIRYRRDPAPARLLPVDPDRCKIVFDTPQPAVTPGQALAVYDETATWLLAGGWIVPPAA